MTTRHKLRQAAALCLTALGRHHDAGPTEATRQAMSSEIAPVVVWLLGLRVAPATAREDFFAPVERELMIGFGREGGLELYEDFLVAFRDCSLTLGDRHRGGGPPPHPLDPGGTAA